MTAEDRWILASRDGIATLHRNPAAACALGGGEGEQVVDEFTAEALLIQGHARFCKHCEAREAASAT